VNIAFGNLPFAFEPNRGQADPHVEYVARGRGYSLLLMPGQAVIGLAKPLPKSAARNGVLPERALIGMKLAGAKVDGHLDGVDALPGHANYFIGNDPTRWRTAIPTYSRVVQRDAYPGIDVFYYGNAGQLEYDFVVAPGSDPKAIRMRFEGIDRMTIDATGALALKLGADTLRMRKPVLYQLVDGVRRDIAGRYVKRGSKLAGFDIGRYDRRLPLVIDPVMVYNTYLGGTGNDIGQAIAVDALGSAYIGGYTNSVDFPVSPGAAQGVFGAGGLGNPDGFVTKLNPAGNAIVYSTYLGGSCTDMVFGIAVDALGQAHVTGGTGSGSVMGFPDCAAALPFNQFPQVNAFQPGYGGGQDAFVAKLNAAGTSLIYSSFLGGSNMDTAHAIALDLAGNAYVAGDTISFNFPTTPGAFQTLNAGSLDAFVVRSRHLRSSTIRRCWAAAISIARSGSAVDSGGQAYVTGITASGSVNGCNIRSRRRSRRRSARSSRRSLRVHRPRAHAEWAARRSRPHGRCVRHPAQFQRDRAAVFHVPGRRNRRGVRR
jgi:hypothetical protein